MYDLRGVKGLSSVQDGTVAVGEETEVMGEGVVIDRAPIAANESADQQQEGRLRLVEIGDQLIHHVELVTRLDHDLCFAVKGILLGRFQIVQDRL